MGATHPNQLREIRDLAGDMPLLIPGVGAQGGSLEEAATLGTDGFRKPAVINVSRSVLYASNDKEFAQRARQELEKLNAAVNLLRSGRGQTATPPQPTVEEPLAAQDQPAPSEPPPAQ